MAHSWHGLSLVSLPVFPYRVACLRGAWVGQSTTRLESCPAVQQARALGLTLCLDFVFVSMGISQLCALGFSSVNHCP